MYGIVLVSEQSSCTSHFLGGVSRLMCHHSMESVYDAEQLLWLYQSVSLSVCTSQDWKQASGSKFWPMTLYSSVFWYFSQTLCTFLCLKIFLSPRSAMIHDNHGSKVQHPNQFHISHIFSFCLNIILKYFETEGICVSLWLYKWTSTPLRFEILTSVIVKITVTVCSFVDRHPVSSLQASVFFPWAYYRSRLHTDILLLLPTAIYFSQLYAVCSFPA